MPRDREDHTGHVIDAADRLQRRLDEEHIDLLNDGHVEHDGGAELLHLLVMTWIDREADAGLLDREAPEVEVVTKAKLDAIGARLWAERKDRRR